MTLSITATAQALRAQGEDVIGFGAGEPDFNTPENIKQAGIRSIQSNQTHYTPVPGTDELKDAIRSKLKKENGLDYDLNQIVVSCGAKHSFFNVAMVLWEEGDEVLLAAPYWVSYPEIVRLTGAEPVILESTAETEFKIHPEQIDQAVTPNTRAIVLNSPSNPTGAAYTRKELEALTERALAHGLLIVSDEIYEKIVFDGFEQVSVASLSPEVQRNCIVLNGVSKSYAMTGWRIGYLAGQADIAKQVSKLQGQSTSNPTSISQAAALEALTGPQEEVQKMATEFQRRRDTLFEQLDRLPTVSCFRPVGSFYAFPDFSSFYGKKHCGKEIDGSLAFAEYLLQEAKVALVPGVAFGADANARLSFATDVETLKRGLERIAKAVSKLD